MMHLRKILCATTMAFSLMIAPAFAQDVKLDAEQPIEITADSLEVMQKEQMAIFIGNVVAVQGDMRLTAQRMEVHYRTGEQAKGDAQAVSRIKVVDDVLMRTPTETARSKSGVYDVDANLLTLNGDVVLTRGENVVKGESLAYDLTTGKSRIAGAGGVATSTQEGEGGSKGRVRGLFVPSKDE